MNLHFITSISKDYWYSTAKYCIGTWNLPGKVTIYIDQKEGDVDWFNELPFNKLLLNVPNLEMESSDAERAKVMKFWGKSCAQLHAVYNKEEDERIIWLDADIEQIGNVNIELFNFMFDSEIAIMNSGDGEDCWESGLVIFNNSTGKLKVAMNRYRDTWNDFNILNSLWKPYDAQVLGYVAQQRGYFNLCNNPCKNIDALKNSRYSTVFTHWINKSNKKLLAEKYNEGSNLPRLDT